ncbi:SdpI family protein [uncultured Pseudokineococcus sp.]|uniref:SdpI family protein n=1 Tax=uncultured Pseudokineococcus sp. TaxID=1642928 RepID=UPI00262482F9|nr:SdpI family protein [uncultured Pseudokineococcus sp.]
MDVLAGLLVLAVTAAAILLVLRLVRPDAIERRGRNAWVGIRTGTTLRSEAAWVAAHRAAWPLVRGGSLAALAALALLGVAWLATGRGEDLLGLGSVGVMLVWVAPLLASIGPAHEAARAAEDDEH